jgi:hypothetical protein
MRELAGASIWSRKTLESDVFFWKPDKWFKIWFCLVQLANYKDEKQFKRGEVLLTYNEIQLYTKASKHQIESFIKWAKEQGMLGTRKTTRGMFISLLNYDKYQTLENYKSHTETYTEGKRRGNESHTINKNVKNDKNVKNTELPALAGGDEVNQVFKRFYDTLNPQIQFGNLTQRKAAESLIKRYGIQKVIAAIDYAVSVSGDVYAPTITTPVQLRDKLAALIAHQSKTKTDPHKQTIESMTVRAKKPQTN